MRPTLTYGCKIKQLTEQMKQKFITLENKILRKICGPIFDTGREQWRTKYNRELREETGVPWITSYIKRQRIKRYGHA